MSEEFSGQRTTSGRGVRPARTSSARRRVCATWLSSTARRWALKSRPARGTLPWIAATVAVGPGVSALTDGHTARPATGPRSTATRAPAIAAVRRGGRTARTSAQRPAPERATAKVTSGAPPSEASEANAPPGWPKASLAQGKPSNGARSMNASPAVQTQATQSGAPGRRVTSGSRATGTAMITVRAASSRNHTPPTYSPVQYSSGHW